MGRREFTEAEIQELEKNPYVDDVNSVRIIYSEGFKQHFVREYMKGIKPTQIFREAGFDVELIGYKRIERATARWKPYGNKSTLK